MKFRNSEVPFKVTKRSDDGGMTYARLAWFVADSLARYNARRDKLEERKRALRRANRGYRRRNGLSLKYA